MNSYLPIAIRVFSERVEPREVPSQSADQTSEENKPSTSKEKK